MNSSREILVKNSRLTNILSFVSVGFPFLWIGMIVSLFGDHLNEIGLIWYVNNSFHGISGTMSLGFSAAIPLTVVSLIAGAVVDRYNRTRILLNADLIRAALLAILVLELLLFRPNLIIISLFTILLGIVSMLYTPAVQSLLPDIAEGNQDKIIKMDAWILTTMSTVGVISPAIVGVLIPYLTIYWILGIDLFTFVFSFLMTWIMVKQLAKNGINIGKYLSKKPNLFKSAFEGFSFIFRNPVLGPQFTAFPMLEAIAFSLPYLIPSLIKNLPGGGGWVYGATLAFWAIGRVIAMSLFPKTTLKKHRGIVFSLNLIVQGAAIIVIALSGSMWQLFAGFFVLGLPGGAAMMSMSSYIQVEMPKEMRGRIFATMRSLAMVLTPMGTILFGILSLRYGVGSTLLYTGILVAIGGLYITSRKAIRQVR